MLSSGKGRLSNEGRMVLLCKEMKWTYFEYMSQPTWFTELIETAFNLEAEYQNKQERLNKMRNAKRRT